MYSKESELHIKTHRVLLKNANVHPTLRDLGIVWYMGLGKGNLKSASRDPVCRAVHPSPSTSGYTPEPRQVLNLDLTTLPGLSVVLLAFNHHLLPSSRSNQTHQARKKQPVFVLLFYLPDIPDPTSLLGK